MTEQLVRSGVSEAIRMVLDGLDSRHSKRAYERALKGFLAWHERQGRPPLTKALVQRYATELREAGLSAGNINQRLSAIRKLALEASDNGYIESQISNGIKAIKGMRQEGHTAGVWLEKGQAQALLNQPDTEALKGLRDRAILAVSLGCGLRRRELAELTFEQIRQAHGRWVIFGVKGKRNKLRDVPMPSFAKAAIDTWAQAAGIASGRVFRPLNKGGKLEEGLLTEQAIFYVVLEHARGLGFEVAPHDLRRTCARLMHEAGGAMDQIQLILGHDSIRTTEKYIGVRQNLKDAPCDRLGLTLES